MVVGAGAWGLGVPSVACPFLCLDVCFSFAELKLGISQDLTSSPKLDRYKIARQLTEKAIQVGALGAWWGGALFKVTNLF